MRLGMLVSAVAVVVLGGLAVSSASASREPRATEKAALAQALRVPRRCVAIRVATVRQGWASVTLRSPLPRSCLKYAADGVNVMRLRDDVWYRRFSGSSWACPIPHVPEDVRKDLGLGCPEGGP
jgi:hypothetical protein